MLCMQMQIPYFNKGSADAVFNCSGMGILNIDLNNKEYNQKLYHFSGFTKNDVNLVKPIFRLYIPKVINKVFITYGKNLRS